MSPSWAQYHKQLIGYHMAILPFILSIAWMMGCFKFLEIWRLIQLISLYTASIVCAFRGKNHVVVFMYTCNIFANKEKVFHKNVIWIHPYWHQMWIRQFKFCILITCIVWRFFFYGTIQRTCSRTNWNLSQLGHDSLACLCHQIGSCCSGRHWGWGYYSGPCCS